MFATLLACLLAATGCGGGSGDNFADAPSSTAGAPVATDARTPDLRESATQLAASEAKAATPEPSDIGTSPIKRATLTTSLASPASDPDAGLRGVARTELCREGFAPPADLTRNIAAPLPAAGAVFFSGAELATWRERTKNGPFVADGDFSASSPGDWNRIRAAAERFLVVGEVLTADDESTRSRHGQMARDAAFAWLIDGDAKLLAAVRTWLVTQANDAGNDFATRRCYVAADGTARDGYFAEAPWLARYVATFDFVRAALPARERIVIENFVRRQAWFFAAQLDWGLREIFPARLAGNYAARGASAAASGEAVWWQRRVDDNGDCAVDGRDDPKPYPVYTHVSADGTLGNRVSELAMWFNNRRAANALAAGAAGVLLGDAQLVERAKRYTMEWLTWGVYADGSTSEYMRHGEYCVARQGLIYGAMNVQSGVMLARLLARQGDRSLVDFATSEGLFGTESPAQPKTLARAAQTLLEASTGGLDWYRAEPQRERQQPRAATALANPRIHYLGTQAMDTMHELALLASAAAVPRVAVAEALLAHPLITRSKAVAGSVPVVTGLGNWTDAFGVLPAAYLLRP